MTECFYCGRPLGSGLPDSAREHPGCSKEWHRRESSHVCVRCGKNQKQLFTPRCASCVNDSPYMDYPGAAA